MKKRIVKLNESDLELLVKKIIKEEEMDPNGSEEGSDEDNPRDVQMFLDAMKKYFMDKYPRFANKVNTRKEKAMLLAALAEELGVDTNMINMAKGELKKSGINK